IRPARTAEECERAEDRAADDEVHRQHTELPVGGDVSGDASAGPAPGEQTDGERDREISDYDGRDDVPAFHLTTPRRRVQEPCRDTRSRYTAARRTLQ